MVVLKKGHVVNTDAYRYLYDNKFKEIKKSQRVAGDRTILNNWTTIDKDPRDGVVTLKEAKAALNTKSVTELSKEEQELKKKYSFDDPQKLAEEIKKDYKEIIKDPKQKAAF